MFRLVFLFFVSMFSVAFAESFQEYLDHEAKAFKAYKDAQDKAFASFLEEPWKAFKTKKTQKELKPKPKIIKPIPKTQKAPVVKKSPVVKPKPLPKITQPKTIIIPKAKPVAQTAKFTKNTLLFYGYRLEVRYDNPLENIYSTMIDDKKITQAWKRFATSEYRPLLQQIKATIKALNLNDWGVRKLLEKIATRTQFRNPNEARLFSWFMLTKMGFDVKAAYTRSRVILFVPINTKLYSTTFITVNGRRYYAIDYAYSKQRLGKIYTYEKSHPKAKERFDMRISKRPYLKSLPVKKTLSFEFEGKRYDLPLVYDKVYVAYFKNYPQVDYENYFIAPTSPDAQKSFHKSLSRLLKGKSEVEAVNFLLRLVQKGLEYQTDEEQFGYEKVMLPEETLYYPYSDCEDRAILFSKLVRELLGLKVVGIKYPQHLATAVALKSTLKGAYKFTKKGTTYYMADPTYIGADVGMVAPAYQKSSFEVIYPK